MGRLADWPPAGSRAHGTRLGVFGWVQVQRIHHPGLVHAWLLWLASQEGRGRGQRKSWPLVGPLWEPDIAWISPWFAGLLCLPSQHPVHGLGLCCCSMDEKCRAGRTSILLRRRGRRRRRRMSSSRCFLLKNLLFPASSSSCLSCSCCRIQLQLSRDRQNLLLGLSASTLLFGCWGRRAWRLTEQRCAALLWCWTTNIHAMWQSHLRVTCPGHGRHPMPVSSFPALW